MKIKPVLQATDFGSEVAEHDEGLQRYFVETSAFQDVINDRVDLILGPKGSGKTAIFRRLADPSIAIPELLDADILPAFNVHGSPIFQKLATAQPLPSESNLRLTWWAYVLALVGNHLIKTYSHLADVAPLRSSLERAHLFQPESGPESVWKALTSGVRHLTHPTAVEATIGLTSVSAKAMFSQTDKTPHLDIEKVLSAEHDILRTLNRRCWVVFDRLDESFMESREAERNALRALLRTHMELASYSLPLKTKLFLRTDVRARITKHKGFTNVTHLRDAHIVWDRESIRDLIARRAYESVAFRAAFGMDSPTFTFDRHAVWDRLVPSKIERSLGFRWIVLHVTDGRGEPNPRNVVSLLRAGKARQLAICQRDDPDLRTHGPLIGIEALTRAWRDVSQKRLEDTLYAEASELRVWIGKFFQCPAHFDRSTLAELLEVDGSSPEFPIIVGELLDAGFLKRFERSEFMVAPLYAPALKSAQLPLTPMDGEETQTTERVRSAPTKTAAKGTTPKVEKRLAQLRALLRTQEDAAQKAAAHAAAAQLALSESRRSVERARQAVETADASTQEALRKKLARAEANERQTTVWVEKATAKEERARSAAQTTLVEITAVEADLARRAALHGAD